MRIKICRLVKEFEEKYLIFSNVPGSFDFTYNINTFVKKMLDKLNNYGARFISHTCTCIHRKQEHRKIEKFCLHFY